LASSLPAGSLQHAIRHPVLFYVAYPLWASLLSKSVSQERQQFSDPLSASVVRCLMRVGHSVIWRLEQGQILQFAERYQFFPQTWKGKRLFARRIYPKAHYAG
jgi:hypothetical protein